MKDQSCFELDTRFRRLTTWESDNDSLFYLYLTSVLLAGSASLFLFFFPIGSVSGRDFP